MEGPQRTDSSGDTKPPDPLWGTEGNRPVVMGYLKGCLFELAIGAIVVGIVWFLACLR